jgi:hypothetical protein
MYDIQWIIQLDILVRREAGTGGSMDRRAARSSDTELKWLHSLELLSLLYRIVSRDCNSEQFLAIAIIEASDMEVNEACNLFNPVQLVATDMIQASVIWSQQYRFNDCSPIQW